MFVPAVPLILVDLLAYINAPMHIKNILIIKGQIMFIYWHCYYTWYIKSLVDYNNGHDATLSIKSK